MVTRGSGIDQFMKDNADLLDSLSMQENYDKSIASLRSQLEAAKAEVERLSAFEQEWGAKDGNSPGYNRDKARNYGRIAYEQRCRAEAAESQLEACRALNGKLRESFKAHLDTMSAINQHMGYPFSQPLINAREALAQTEEQAGAEWSAMREDGK